MGPHKDRLQMAVLFFLGSVICAQTKVGNGAKNVLDFFQRAVDDLDLCRTFPWGRYSFDYMLKEISHTMDHFGGLVKENALWPLPGFCIPLEILAFEAIHKLGKRFREAVEGADVKCPRMCKSTFKPNGMKGMSLSDIYKELGDETDFDSILPTRGAEEENLLDEIMEDEDDVDEPDLAVDSWDKRLDEGFSVFFQDMFEEDVAAREEPAGQEGEADHAEPVEEAQHVTEQSTNLGKVVKMMKKMVKQLKIVESKVDKLDTRLEPLEAFVNRVKKTKKKK